MVSRCTGLTAEGSSLHSLGTPPQECNEPVQRSLLPHPLRPPHIVTTRVFRLRGTVLSARGLCCRRGAGSKASDSAPEFSSQKFRQFQRANGLASESPAAHEVVEPRVRSSHLKVSREERKSLAAGLPERVPKLHVFGQVYRPLHTC